MCIYMLHKMAAKAIAGFPTFILNIIKALVQSFSSYLFGHNLAEVKHLQV